MNAQEAITQYVDAANGIRFAYRKIGKPSEVSLICHNHFRGNMDWWDPLLLNTIAAKREVVLFDGPGVGKTGGRVPDTFEGWAADMVAFVEALRLEEVDLLGYSLGARAVQTAALMRPDMVRKMILAGASPVMWTPDSPKDTRDPRFVIGMATATGYQESKDAFRLALFGESDAGRKIFEDYWKRLEERMAEPPLLDALGLEPGGNNQISAVLNADKPENAQWPDRLTKFKMPVLVANGENDLTLSTSRTLGLYTRLPNAQLVLYPNSGHGFLWQYPILFGDQVNMFLDTTAFDVNI